MFSDIPSVRAELEQRLADVLPKAWRVESEIAAPDAALAPAVYIEFVELASTFNSTPLPPGMLAAGINVILTDPRTDRHGEATVEEHLVKVIEALDPHDDLAWDTATKQRIERSGSWSWQLKLSAFVSTITAPEPITTPEE